MPVPAEASLPKSPKPTTSTDLEERIPSVLLSNIYGRITRHWFIRVELRKDESERALIPIFACEQSGAERSYGRLRPTTTKKAMETFYGLLQLERYSWPGCVRAWIPAGLDLDDGVQPIEKTNGQ